MKKVIFIINPNAGKRKIKQKISTLTEILCIEGYLTTLYYTNGKNDILHLFDELLFDFDLLLCSGGDGTVDEMVTVLLQKGIDVPIGYLPSGTTNDFARTLKIPFEPTDALRVALNGIPKYVDIGRINEHYFTYVAAFGCLTEVTYQTSQEMKNNFGYIAYILEGIKKLPVLMKGYKMKIVSDSYEEEKTYLLGLVTNTLSVGGFSPFKLTEIELDDGEFECCFIEMPPSPLELQGIIASLLKQEFTNKYIHFFRTSLVKIYAEVEVPWTADGEFSGNYTEVCIENLPRKIGFIVPKIK